MLHVSIHLRELLIYPHYMSTTGDNSWVHWAMKKTYVWVGQAFLCNPAGTMALQSSDAVDMANYRWEMGVAEWCAARHPKPHSHLPCLIRHLGVKCSVSTWCGNATSPVCCTYPMRGNVIGKGSSHLMSVFLNSTLNGQKKRCGWEKKNGRGDMAAGTGYRRAQARHNGGSGA